VTRHTSVRVHNTALRDNWQRMRTPTKYYSLAAVYVNDLKTKLHLLRSVVDLLYNTLYNKYTNCTTGPQQMEVVEIGLYPAVSFRQRNRNKHMPTDSVIHI